MNRRWLTFAMLLPLVALALFIGSERVARHHETDGTCRAFSDSQPTPVAFLIHPVLEDAATSAAREPLPDVGTEPQPTRPQAAFCSDGTLALLAFTSHLRASVLRHPPTSHPSILAARGHLRPVFTARLERNASPTTHTVLLI